MQSFAQVIISLGLKAVTARHDIVHRNGRSVGGKAVVIGEKEVVDLLSEVRRFAHDLEEKLAAIEAQISGAPQANAAK